MNWVKARGSCNARAIFQALKKRVEDDVREFGQLESADRACIVAEGERGDGVFWVRSPHHAAVKFERNRHRVIVAGVTRADDFCVEFEWNDETDSCRLLVDGQPLEVWQIAKRALSPLMFG